jgi:hypothetical protein
MFTSRFCLHTVLTLVTIVFLLTDGFVYLQCAYATITYMAANQPRHKASLFQPTSDIPTDASNAFPLATSDMS